MIFVTVGTHEQQFNRLISYIDEVYKNEEVFFQLGYSTYIPKYHEYEKLISRELMYEYMIKSDVVITHGGPSSIMEVLAVGKIPIVVPRQKKYKEHVNNHQLDFCRILAKDNKILLVEDVSMLSKVIDHVLKNQNSLNKLNSNNKKFVEELEKLIIQLF